MLVTFAFLQICVFIIFLVYNNRQRFHFAKYLLEQIVKPPFYLNHNVISPAISKPSARHAHSHAVKPITSDLHTLCKRAAITSAMRARAFVETLTGEQRDMWRLRRNHSVLPPLPLPPFRSACRWWVWNLYVYVYVLLNQQVHLSAKKHEHVILPSIFMVMCWMISDRNRARAHRDTFRCDFFNQDRIFDWPIYNRDIWCDVFYS